MQVDRTRVYKVSAVAEALDLSRSTVYRAIESGELDALRIGKSVRIPGTALAAWLDKCAQDAYEHHVLAGEPVADLDEQPAQDAAVGAEVAAR